MASNGPTKKVATDFEKIIQEGRDRKKNEALAARIFSKDRRSSAPFKASGTASSGPLASRAGVKKPQQQRAVSSTAPRHSTGNIDGEWTHDLHGTNGPRGPKNPQPAPGSLAARITNPNAGPAGNPRQKRRAAQVAQALIRTELQQQRPNGGGGARQQQASFITPQSASAAGIRVIPTGPAAQGAFSQGLSIRGLAGPYVVLAQNFAPGTTAADIESAMTPVGGIITSCRLVKAHPLVIAELAFESKEGAERAIATFNGQTADGRVLSVFPKPGNVPLSDTQATSATPSGPRAMRDNDAIVDGTLGFDDPMEMDDGSSFSNGNGRAPPRGPAADTGGLYSDSLVRSGGSTNRHGRGFGRGGGGRGR
ncbi:hypothetical protein B0T25DRAFT_150114 [Lasiosphaeria hispida]|uniref:RRM domain-containing protein n=1 Tax=Lasiosphaeria hispida TaxID=260671 RepID=A0AAJ0MG73_9PEZI|nr:hypothetical protein B0T25DRAFT_150114 [Lasiosphaeria hispida]